MDKSQSSSHRKISGSLINRLTHKTGYGQSKPLAAHVTRLYSTNKITFKLKKKCGISQR